MLINSSIIKGILKSLETNDQISQQYIKDKNAYASVFRHEMVPAAIYLQLISTVRKKHPDIVDFSNMLRYINLLDIGLSGHFLYTCKNIFVAYDRMIKYQLLISNFINIRYKSYQNEIHWLLQMPYQLYKEKFDMEAAADYELLLRFKVEEALSNRTPRPKRIELFHSSSDLSLSRIRFFSKKFNCEVVSNRSSNVIIYDKEKINKENPYQNFELYKHTDILMLRKVTELYRNTENRNTITSILLNNMDRFPLSLSEIAQRLFMSPRKLQLILQKENTSYQELLNETKVLVAQEAIGRKKSLKEIAAKLGYKDVSSFIRFFVQQTKQHPYNDY